MEKPFARSNGINVGFWRRGWNTIRGFYFQITPVNKKLSYAIYDIGPFLEDLFTPGEGPVLRHRLIP